MADSVILKSQTLIFVIVLISSYLILVMGIYGRTQRTYGGYWMWLGGSILLTTSYLLGGLRGIVPDVLTIPLPNTLSLVGGILHIGGVQRFLGQPLAIKRYFWLVPVLFLGQLYFLAVQNSMSARSILHVPINMYIVLVTVRLLATNSPPGARVLYRAFSVSILLFTLGFTLRALYWALVPGPHTPLDETPINHLFLVLFVPVDISWALFFILMHNQRMGSELKQLHAELEQRASFDALTGTYNRRTFLDLSETALVKARQTGKTLSLLMFDLDWFKVINDEFGHAAGDEALKAVAENCDVVFQRMGVVGRFGGDEFLILYPSATLEQAMDIAEYLRASIQTLPLTWTERFPLGITVGVAELAPDDTSMDDLIRRADAMLYARKRERGPRPTLNGSAPRDGAAVEMR